MEKQKSILLVDDARINRELLSEILSDDYNIIQAENGAEALVLMSRHISELELVLLDIMMPVMDGFEVLSVMKKSGYLENLPVIIISAETSMTAINRAYDLGAVEFINRPFDEKTVKRRVYNTIMLYSKQRLLTDIVTEQVLQKEKTNNMMVEILSHIVEFGNNESGPHIKNIKTLTRLFLNWLSKTTDRYHLTPERISLISTASALHDIGKITIPDAVLNKPGRLTPEEYEIIKTHSAEGAKILDKITIYKNEELVRIATTICRSHHERYDGRGYPDGLKGDEIPIEAQVVSLADVYDALTSPRVYKQAFSHAQAVDMILKGECGVFNPLLLECLKKNEHRLSRELTEKVNSSESSELFGIMSTLVERGRGSTRALSILEQERTKLLFLIKTSDEIYFEYNRDSDMLTLSEAAAKQLSLPIAIPHPESSELIKGILSQRDFAEILKAMYNANAEAPDIGGDYMFNIKGKAEKYRLFMRPLWLMDISHEKIGFIGKLSKVEQAAK